MSKNQRILFACLGSIALLWGCGGTPTTLIGIEHCDNGEDDNGDQLVDCADPQCTGHASCNPYIEYACDNNADDDGDGAVDCADSDCALSQACNPDREMACANGEDDDLDGVTDCLDPDCWGTDACLEICDDNVDNDLDGATDCDDVDCWADEACASVVYPEICDNQVDDDGDGLVDCEDDDCASAAQCRIPPEVCNNEGDDDGDGLADCADPDCAANPWCFEYDCTDGLDFDGDGLTDCQDPDCAGQPGCTTNTSCEPTLSISCGDTVTSTTVGRLDNLSGYGAPCPSGSYPGPERYYSYTATDNVVLTVTVDDPSDVGLELFALGSGLSGCAPGDCRVGSSSSSGTDMVLYVPVAMGETVYIVVDSPTSAGGAFTLTSLCEVDCGQLTNCFGTCRDLMADPLNCGDCERICNIPNAVPACDGGDCIIASCTAPYDDCDQDPANGCEANLDIDVENCGTCYNGCAMTAQCAQGQCGLIGVDCNGVICPNQQQCCLSGGTEYCFDPSTDVCTGWSGTCDGPEDCAPGQVCCHDPGGAFASCTTQSACSTNIYFCSSNADCPSMTAYCCPAMDVFAICSDTPCSNP